MTTKEYNTCVDCFADSLLRFLIKSVHDRQMAEDLVQDAFEKLWIRRDQVDGEKAKSYLYTIAYNAMIDKIRRESRLSPIEAAPRTAASNQDHYSDLNELLHEAIRQLPKQQQSVVLLRDYEGYSYEEIADITGLSPSQVKVYIFRARTFLKEYIGSIEKLI